jgi:hypothetical protein
VKGERVGAVVRSGAVVAVGLLATLLAGCSSGSSAGSIDGAQQALDALTSLGVECEVPEVTQAKGIPFTRIACPGLQVEWVDDEDDYTALRRSDCAAVPADRRAGMADITLVVGDRWLIRGNGSVDVDAWPSGISPEQAAQELGGEVVTAADYCARLGAWTS